MPGSSRQLHTATGWRAGRERWGAEWTSRGGGAEGGNAGRGHSAQTPLACLNPAGISCGGNSSAATGPLWRGLRLLRRTPSPSPSPSLSPSSSPAAVPSHRCSCCSCCCSSSASSSSSASLSLTLKPPSSRLLQMQKKDNGSRSTHEANSSGAATALTRCGLPQRASACSARPPPLPAVSTPRLLRRCIL